VAPIYTLLIDHTDPGNDAKPQCKALSSVRAHSTQSTDLPDMSHAAEGWAASSDLIADASDYVNAITDVLTSNNLTNAVLVAHSLSGVWTQLAAQQVGIHYNPPLALPWMSASPCWTGTRSLESYNFAPGKNRKHEIPHMLHDVDWRTKCCSFSNPGRVLVVSCSLAQSHCMQSPIYSWSFCECLSGHPVP
jgi:hypothetical protein